MNGAGGTVKVCPVTLEPAAVNAVLQGLLKEADDEQVRMMEERVILVDYNDKAVGSGSKKESEFRFHRAADARICATSRACVARHRRDYVNRRLVHPPLWLPCAHLCSAHLEQH
jgi:hypothetical protein